MRRHIQITFPAAVPTVVVAWSIGILMSIRPVALLVVRDEIVEREPVVTRYVVHALVRMVRMLTVVREQIGAAVQT